jgi:hypothetical protein
MYRAVFMSLQRRVGQCSTVKMINKSFENAAEIKYLATTLNQSTCHR